MCHTNANNHTPQYRANDHDKAFKHYHSHSHSHSHSADTNQHTQDGIHHHHAQDNSHSHHHTPDHIHHTEDNIDRHHDHHAALSKINDSGTDKCNNASGLRGAD